MSRTVDMSVRARLTFSVHEYTSGERTGSAHEVSSGLTLDAANELARTFAAAPWRAPSRLQTLKVDTVDYDFQGDDPQRPDWLQDASAWLALRPAGTLIMVERVDGSDRMRARLTTVIPARESVAGEGPWTFSETSTFLRHTDPLADRLTQVENVVANLKNSVIREVSRLNLPERWDDLSRETTKRGLETFMAVQAAAKAHWPDHEIEALINNIQKRTGKSKIALRSMFETATEKARAALAEVEKTVRDRDPLAPIVTLTDSASAADIKAAVKTVLETGYKPTADELIQAISGATGHHSGAFLLWVKEVLEEVGGDALTEQEELYCRHRAQGMKPISAAQATGYTADSAHTLESAAAIRRRIEALMSEAPAVTEFKMDSGVVWEVPADQVPSGLNGSRRLENASQEFFALNIGFYGMTVEDAATQMSLPLVTAEGLMKVPSVCARIEFFQRCRAAGDGS